MILGVSRLLCHLMPPSCASGQADAQNVPAPDDLAVHWLGGYWKLPKQDMASTDLRERVVSVSALGIS